MEQSKRSPEELLKAEHIITYYMRDDLPQPDDDETRTIPPFHTMIKQKAEQPDE